MNKQLFLKIKNKNFVWMGYFLKIIFIYQIQFDLEFICLMRFKKKIRKAVFGIGIRWSREKKNNDVILVFYGFFF